MRLVTRWVVFGLLVLLGLILLLGPVLAGTWLLDSIIAGVGFVVYVAMGGLVIHRLNGHATGWLLVITGLAVVFANGFAVFPGVSPELGAWVGSWSWTLVFSLYAALALTFPSGFPPAGPRPLARAGRMAVWLLPVLVLTAALTNSLGGPEMFSGVDSPVGFLPDWISYLAPLVTMFILLGASVALVVRRGRAKGVERAQLTWVVFALAILGSSAVLTFAFILVSIAIGAGDPGDDAWGPVFVVMIMFPIAFAVAVLRYRLYEIDKLVSRTVTYAIVAALLAITFGLSTLTLGAIVGRDDPLTVAGATLAAFALFNPARHRVQVLVDRRFDRGHYDAERELHRLTRRLANTVDLDTVVNDAIDVVARTVHPRTAAIWIRGAGKPFD